MSVELIDNLAGTVPIELIKESLRLLCAPATSPSDLRSFVLETFARSALPPSQFLYQLVPFLMNNPTALPTANAIQKSLILDRAAGSESRIGEGADETIQILDFFIGTRMIIYPKEFKTNIQLI